jgi:hypothetical protein
MAITQPILYADLIASRAAAPFPFAGVSFERLAMALSVAIPQWAPLVSLTGIATGTLGGGFILPASTRLTLTPPDPFFLVGFQSAGLNGPLGAALSQVLSTALLANFSTYGQYQGVSSVCGVGADVSRATSAPPFAPILMPQLTAFLGGGPLMPSMAAAIDLGISSWLLTATGVGLVTGGTSALPGTGPTVSNLI